VVIRKAATGFVLAQLAISAVVLTVQPAVVLGGNPEMIIESQGVAVPVHCADR
jgi:hypothetical protein